MTETDPERTRSTLIQRLRNPKDAEAWNEAWSDFFRIYKGPIRSVLCKKMGMSEHDADDVSQEILLIAKRKVEREEYRREQGSFKFWLLKVARNKVLEHFGKPERRMFTGRGEFLDNLSGSVASGRIVPEPGSADPLGLEQLTTSSVIQLALEKVRPGVSEKAWRAFEITSVTREKGTDGAIYCMVSKNVRHGTVDEAARELAWPADRVYREKHKVMRRFKDVMRDLTTDD
jgi:DNA-directed RNA polymerase specialized sigma24 family protein